MKKALTILMIVFVSSLAKNQVLKDTVMKVKFYKGPPIYNFRMPLDTFKLLAKDSGALAIRNEILYLWNGYKWKMIVDERKSYSY